MKQLMSDVDVRGSQIATQKDNTYFIEYLDLIV